MSKEPEINRLREKAVKSISTDPRKEAISLVGGMAFMAQTGATLGFPRELIQSLVEQMAEEHLLAFKTKVQEVLLESQKATGDALAAALQMRGQS